MADFWKGLSHLGRKFGGGFLRSIEGLVDFTVGGIADAFGADEFAEELMGNDWIDYEAADRELGEDSGFWKVAGDIFGGIGSSAPALLTAIGAGALTAVTGGAAAPLAIKAIGVSSAPVIAGIGAAGSATSEAYKQTGELGAEEYGYGALSGAVEGGLEAATAGLGKGVTAAGKSLGKTIAKEGAESATKAVAKTAVKEGAEVVAKEAVKEAAEEAVSATAKSLGKETAKTFALNFGKKVGGDMLSEGFEEGVTEWIDPYLKRMTYDESAKNATAQEIGYAALIGALSGGITTGVTRGVESAIDTVRDRNSGKKAIEKGEAEKIIDTARKVVNYASNNESESEAAKDVAETLKKLDNNLSKSEGKVTDKDARLIGRLSRGTVGVITSDLMTDAVENIIADVDGFVEMFNSYGMMDENGNRMTVTREELTGGYDLSTRKGREQALKNNAKLRSIAAMDAAGRLMLDTAAMKQSLLRGEAIATDRWLAKMYETATEAELDELSAKLGVDMRTATADEINAAVRRYRHNPDNAAVLKGISEARRIAPEDATKLPNTVTLASNGTRRYRINNTDIAVIKNGENYLIYEYDTKDVSHALNVAELNAKLKEIKRQSDAAMGRENATQGTNVENATNDKGKETKKSDRQIEAERIDKLLRDNVKAYKEISDGSQTLVRQVYRQALAHGLSEAEALSFARVSAHSGLNIFFSKELCRTNQVNEDGTPKYADGYYSEAKNRIVINPDGSRSMNDVIIHELDHAIRRAYKGKTTVYMRQVWKNLTDTEKINLRKNYEGVKTNNKTLLYSDEFNAYFAEKCLKNKKLQDILFERKGLLEKVVDFFTGASKAYSDDPKLARAAKWYEKRYRKMFEDLSARNKGRNAVDTVIGKNSDNISFALMNKNSLADNVKAVLNMGEAEAKRNKAEGNFVSIMPKTPSVITDNVKDAENLEIIMRFDSFYLATRKDGVLDGHYHNYGEIMAKLPEIIASPEAIVRMDNGRLNLISSVRGTKGNNSILSIELNMVKDINSKNTKYNMVISVIPANDNYTKNNLKNHGIKVEYKKEDLAQVNHQLYEWLATINDKSSKVIIPNPDEKVNTSDKKSLEIPSDASLALPTSQGAAASPTVGNVGKTSFKAAEAKVGERIRASFGTVADRLYIETVDETFGIEKYLRTVGKLDDAIPFVQQVRAAETMAQTMIGTDQYDITDASGKGKRLGDGLATIFKPIRTRGKVIEGYDAMFDDYLLHQLNVDRMTLAERSIAEQNDRITRLAELDKKLGNIKRKLTLNKKEYESMKGKRDDESKTRRAEIREENKKLVAEHNSLNLERRTVEKAINAFVPLENKPVFGENAERKTAITAEESRKIIEEYEKKHPQFKEIAEKVWKYSDNLLEMRVNGGLISAEDAEQMRKLYPHYVPSFRDKESGGAVPVKGANNLEVSSTIKRAKGGGEDIISIEESLAKQTAQAVKAIQINRLARAIYNAADITGDKTYVEIVEKRKADSEERNRDIDIKPKTNQITFYLDGEIVDMRVAKEIFAGFKGLTSSSVPDLFLAKVLNKGMNTFKNLVTQWNPAFAARNFVRDMQDAFINSRHPKAFMSSMKESLMGIVNNSDYWKEYRAYGGFASTVFDTKGFTEGVGTRGFEAFKSLVNDTDGSILKILKGAKTAAKDFFIAIGNANAFIEQLTRFTEYVASRKAGDNIQTAINNSAEVTTNFSRRGSVTKVLNSTVIPFLNASIQGFDKLARVLTGPAREKSMRALAVLLAKIFAMGITPMIINSIRNAGDEDYENLEEEVRENYFLIKAGDSFIKIPRGRAASVFGGAANRIMLAAKGEDADLKGYLENISTQVSPVESFSRTIFAPINDVKTNTTWYGGEIEGRQFENVRPRDRYDESTSEIAKWIGDKLNRSPKKIHYLLDQYSGVIGDFVLPATTKKGERDYFTNNFTLDPVTNNKLSGKFYDLYEETQYKKNEGDATAVYQLKRMNEVKDSIGKMYDEITAIQNSDLSTSEKLEQTRVIRILINNAYKSATADYSAYNAVVESTAGMFDESSSTGVKMRYTEITRRMYGAEKAFEVYGASVSDKMSVLNNTGIDYDTLYSYYFGTKDIQNDYDKKGNVIEGSKKEKTLKVIDSLNLTKDQKNLLVAAKGYAASNKKQLLKYILSLKISKEQKLELAKICGFEVKNGTIVRSSVA